jgi:SNF2 family DNA or RNA helicase
MLRILSVVYFGVNVTTWKRIMDRLDFTTQGGSPLAKSLTKKLRDRLLREELLLSSQGKLCCTPYLREVLSREAVEEGFFESVLEVVPEFLDLGAPRDAQWRPQWDWEWELFGTWKLRNAIYCGHEAKALKILGLAPKNPYKKMLSEDRHEGLWEILGTPIEAAYCATLPPAILFHLLARTVLEGATSLQSMPITHRLAEQVLPTLAVKHPLAALVLAEFRLHQGRMDAETEGLLLGSNDPHGVALLGWLRLLQGRNEEAQERFETALKLKKKSTRKRRVYLQGFPGLLHLTLLLKLGGKQRWEEIRKLIHIQEDELQDGPFHLLFLQLEEVVGQRLGIYPQDLEGFLSKVPGKDYQVFDLPAWSLLFWGILQYFLGQPVPRSVKKQLQEFQIQAENAGLLWFAGEAATLQVVTTRKCSGKEEKSAGGLTQGWTPLVEGLKPKPIWEVALDSLQEIGKPEEANSHTSSDEPDFRMTWRLSFYGKTPYLEPWEQKKNKRGCWTKGRKVALQRLMKPEDFDYLTPLDLAMCACIRKTEEWRGSWGRYRDFSYNLDGVKALLAGVGHPLIFQANNPLSPVEVVLQEPALEVRQEGDLLHLNLLPNVGVGQEIQVVPKGKDRVEMIRFTQDHLRIAEILGNKGLQVPVMAREQVLDSISSLAPLLTVHSDIGGGSEARKVPTDSRLHVHLQPAGEGLAIEWWIKPFGPKGPRFRPGQGGRTVFSEQDGMRCQTDRDLARELRLGDKILSQSQDLQPTSEYSWRLEDPESALKCLLELQNQDPEEVLLEWPKGQPIRIASGHSLDQMQLRITKKRDWFGLDGELHIDAERVLAMKDLLNLLEQTPGRFLRLAEGDFLALSEELRRRLDTLRAVADKGQFHPLALGAVDEAAEGMRLKAGKAWKQQLSRIRETNELTPVLPSTLRADLREYQLEGFRWLARLAHWGAGACLADDMGLGKTLQALAVILTRAPEGPTLVLAPTSVCMNWLEEAVRFAPTLKPKRFGPGNRTAFLKHLGPFDLVVCSYGLLQTEAEALAGVEWQTLVADEAQAIKNHQTKRAKAAMGLQAGFRMITTGTPIENHLGELWTLFRFLNPGLLGSLDRFNQRFAGPIEQSHDAGARSTLRSIVRPFLLRRRKSEVLQELPSRTEICIHVELSEEEVVFYEALRVRALERLSEQEDHPGQKRLKILAEITRLRQACCHPRLVLPESQLSSSKLKAFDEIVDELRANGHKALVFSQFVGHLSLLRESLDKQGIFYQYLDGSTSIKKRKAAVDAFQAGEGDLFLISLKAGGSGLNLTAADYVIHMDPWWNPAVEDQASDRAHRLGQKRPVTIYRLVARDTIEEKIVELHRSKRDLADGLLEGSEMTGKMSTEEIMGLIQQAVR